MPAPMLNAVPVPVRLHHQMRIQHGLDIDIPLRLDPRLRVAQSQDSVKRFAIHVLPAV